MYSFPFFNLATFHTYSSPTSISLEHLTMNHSNSHSHLNSRNRTPTGLECPCEMEAIDSTLSPAWSTPEVGYFMPGEYVAGFDKPLAHMETGRDLIPRFYNVHAFVGHLRGILVFKQEAVVRANIHSCLRDDALDWYNTELTHSERVELRDLPVEQGWFKRLIQRFKIPYEIALFRVETAELYRKEVLISRSARNMVRHLQAVGIDSLEEQLSFV